MVCKMQSVVVVFVCGLACLYAADGFRISKRAIIKTTVCPDHVLLNTKGDCVDAIRNDPAEGCCDECIEIVQNAKASYEKQLASYMGTCRLTRGDVSPTGDHIINPDKICSTECQSMSMEHALMELALSEVAKACSSMPQELVPMEPVAKLLESFQQAWMECRKAPEITTTAEPETTSTELSTTLPAVRFPPVQVFGPHEWQLVRDSASLSAGLGYEQNELSIAVLPEGIPMSQLVGWQYVATGHDVVLNIRHGGPRFGGSALRLEVQAEMQCHGSYKFNGAGQFLKDVRFKVINSKTDPLFWLKAHVKAVEAMSHGSASEPIASVSLILELEAASTFIFQIQEWKKTMKYTFWGNGAIHSYFL